MNAVYNSWDQLNNGVEFYLDQAVKKVGVYLPLETYGSAVKTALLWIATSALLHATLYNPLLYLPLRFAGAGLSLGIVSTPLANHAINHIQLCNKRFDIVGKIVSVAIAIFPTAGFTGTAIYAAGTLFAPVVVWGFAAGVVSALLTSSVAHHSTFDFEGDALKMVDQIQQLQKEITKLKEMKAKILAFINSRPELRKAFESKWDQYKKFYHIQHHGIDQYKDSEDIIEQLTDSRLQLLKLETEFKSLSLFLRSEPELFKKFKEECDVFKNEHAGTAQLPSIFLL